MEMAVADKTIFREENERLRQELKSFHSYIHVKSLVRFAQT
jgi:hypothetical protein